MSISAVNTAEFPYMVSTNVIDRVINLTQSAAFKGHTCEARNVMLARPQLPNRTFFYRQLRAALRDIHKPLSYDQRLDLLAMLIGTLYTSPAHWPSQTAKRDSLTAYFNEIDIDAQRYLDDEEYRTETLDFALDELEILMKGNNISLHLSVKTEAFYLLALAYLAAK